MIDGSKQVPRPSTPGRFPGLYRGTIVEREDENLQHRIKASVPAVFGDLSKEDLPWAYPLSFSWPLSTASALNGKPSADSQFNSGGGVGIVPPIGSPVSIMFEDGEPEHPVWMPAGPGNRSSDSPTPNHAYDGKKPDNYYFTTPRGITVQLDDRNGSEKILLRLPEGDYLSIDAGGHTDLRSHEKVRVRAPVKVEISSKSRVEIKAQSASVYGSNQVDVHGGTVNIKGSRGVNIDGGPINLNSGSANPGTGGTTTDTDSEADQDGS